MNPLPDLSTVAGMSKPAPPADAPKNRGPRRWNQEVTGQLRQRILEESDPIEFLGRVMRGDGFQIGDDLVYPTLRERTDVAMELLGKIVPDLKATEVSLGGGKDDGDGRDAFNDLVSLLGRAAGSDGTRPTSH